MASIKELLDCLDPPIRHMCEIRGGVMHLALIDASIPARVHRRLARHEFQNEMTFRMILLYAVNELRGKGSHAPLQAISSLTFGAPGGQRARNDIETAMGS